MKINRIIPGVRGAFYEYPFEERKSRFLEVYIYSYSPEKHKRLIAENIFEHSNLAKFLKLIDRPIPPETKYLYELLSYNAENNHSDLWEFNESITNFKKYGFTDFVALLDFCDQNWGIKKKDFVPIEETNIPY
jgi:hypothetical protein